MNIYREHVWATSYKRIQDALFSYAPDAVVVVEDFREADWFLFYLSRSTNLPLPEELGTGEGGPCQNVFVPAKNRLLRDYFESVGKKPRLFWLDAFGPNNSFHEPPHYITDADIMFTVGPFAEPVPNNAFSIGTIDPRHFYCSNRNRVPKSVLMLYDNVFSFYADTIGILNDLLENGSIEFLKVLAPGNDKKVFDAFPKYPLKVFAGGFTAEDMPKELNNYDYTLQTQVGVGMELVGLEGAFCGAQPIYPDTAYYRDIFDGDDLGVFYFDRDNPFESLTDIFTRPLVWQERYMQNFIEMFSAEIHVPKFWDFVRTKSE